MLREIRPAIVLVVILTLITGLAYPLAMTGIAQVAFPNKANGSQITSGGKLVGSSLIAKPFVVDTGRKDSDGNPITRPDPRYFQPRPSQTDYSATASAFSNRGPNQVSARDFFQGTLKSYLALERRYSPGLTAARVPVDAVTTSGSGVDPDISQANARIQARRIAAVRHLPLSRVDALVRANTDGRFLGVFGEPGVNTTKLNEALGR